MYLVFAFQDIPQFCYHHTKTNVACRIKACSMPHRTWDSFTSGEKQDIANMVSRTNKLNFAPGIDAHLTVTNSKNDRGITPLPRRLVMPIHSVPPPRTTTLYRWKHRHGFKRLGITKPMLVIKRTTTPSNS